MDAIAHIDWLRDKVASHGVKVFTRCDVPMSRILVEHEANVTSSIWWNMSKRDFFDPTPEEQDVVLIDAATLRKAEQLIDG